MPETVADYDIRSPASRTLLTVIGTLVVVGALVGVVLGASVLMRDTRVSTSLVELGGSTQLVVSATSADVRIVETEDDVIRITSRVTSGLRETDYQLGRRGDEIKVISRCQGWLSPGCGVEITFAVPKGLPVIVTTTSGDIDAADVTTGVLTVSSSSGDISGSDLGVDEFSARSRSGDIAASFSGQPFAFKATTIDGDISALLPTGDRTYAVTASSKDGSVSSDLESDDKGAGFIRATSRSGDIRLANR